ARAERRVPLVRQGERGRPREPEAHAEEPRGAEPCRRDEGRLGTDCGRRRCGNHRPERDQGAMIMETKSREPLTESDREQAVSSELAPLYAVAGLTGAVTDRLRTVATESRQQVAKRIAELRTVRPEQVTRAVGELTSRSLPELIRTVPEFTKQRLAKVGEQADVRLGRAGAAYAELAGRGKATVDSAIGQAAGSIDPVLERVQEGVIKLRRSVSGRTASESVTPRSAAKAAATRAAKQAGAEDAPAEKAAAKQAPAEDAPATDPGAEKATAMKESGDQDA